MKELISETREPKRRNIHVKFFFTSFTLITKFVFCFISIFFGFNANVVICTKKTKAFIGEEKSAVAIRLKHKIIILINWSQHKEKKTLSDLEFKDSFLISWQIFVFDGIWWNRLILVFLKPSSGVNSGALFRGWEFRELCMENNDVKKERKNNNSENAVKF